MTTDTCFILLRETKEHLNSSKMLMPMRKHDVSWLKYVIVLGLTIVVFLFGILLGNFFTEKKFENVESIEDNLRIQTAGAELQYLLLLQEPCKYINSTPLAEELYNVGERLDYMEAQRGETDTDVLRLKNTYSLLELRDWLFILKTNEQCRTDFVPALYFYSNAGDCPQCKEQGYTLTYLRKKYPSLRVYAFDMNVENPALDTVKRIYGITETPTLIIGNETYGFTTIGEMEEILVPYNLTRVE
jgi:hypothetical protein